MTKKFFAILLALVLTFAMSTVAFAATSTGTTVLQKSYTLQGDGAVTPSVTFNFSAEFDGYKSDIGDPLVTTGYPTITGDLTLGSVTFNASDFVNGVTTNTKDVTVNLPTYSNVGYYYYTLTETVSNPVAGVGYDDNKELKLVVSVLRNESAADTEAFVPVYYVYVMSDNAKTSDLFANTYSAGKLSVTKMVAGQLGDKTATYPATVTLTSDKAVSSAIKVGGVEQTVAWTQGEDNKYTATINLTLSHNTPVTIENIPAGITYEVVETGAVADTEGKITYGDGYVVTYANNAGTITTTTSAATITNTKAGNIDTGITMDSMPYIVLLALAVVGIAAVTMKKRYEA